VNVPLQSVCPGVSVGHGQLPTTPLVVGIVLRTLRSAALSPPRASDCRSLQALGGLGSRGYPRVYPFGLFTPG
jgi:hypothetical protein